MTYRVLFVGDSNTANPVLTAAQHWPRLLEDKLGNFQAQNLGVPGATMACVVPQWPSWGPSASGTLPMLHGLFGYRAVVTAVGSNDYGIGPWISASGFQAALRSYLGAIPIYRPVLLVGPVWRVSGEVGPNGAGLTMDLVRSITAQLAQDRVAAGGRCLYVDGSAIVPHEQAFYADAVHLNAAGHCVLASGLVPYLTATLA